MADAALVLPHSVTVVVISIDHPDNMGHKCICMRSRWTFVDDFNALGVNGLITTYLGLEAASDEPRHRHVVSPEAMPAFLRDLKEFPIVMITSTENYQQMGQIDEVQFLGRTYFASHKVVDGKLIYEPRERIVARHALEGYIKSLVRYHLTKDNKNLLFKIIAIKCVYFRSDS